MLSVARDDGGRVAALKVVKIDDDVRRDRFLREVAALAALDGHAAPRLMDHGVDGDEGWIAMERVPGPTLEHVLAGRDLLEGLTATATADGAMRRQMLRAATKIAEAVATIHARGFVHLDIKASNIILRSALEPRLVDFGASRRVEETSPPTTTRTLAACAPEQIDPAIGPLSPATDVYALGMLLVRMIAGVDARPRPDAFLRNPRMPFRPDATLARTLGPKLLPVVWACLDVDPRRRYRDAAALADDLKRVLRDDAPAVGLPPWHRRVAAHPAARPVAVAAAFACVVVAAFLVGRAFLPKMCRVSIDALHRGGTLMFEDGVGVVLPVRRLPLAPGTHPVRYVPNDGAFQPLQTTLEVPEDAPHAFHLLPTIPSDPGRGPHGLLGVEAADGATLFVDDVALPPTKGPRRAPLPVKPGRHHLRAVRGSAVEVVDVDVPEAHFVPVVLLPSATADVDADFRATWGGVLGPKPASIRVAADPGVGVFVNEFAEPTLLGEGRLGPRTCFSIVDPDGRSRSVVVSVTFPEPMRGFRVAMTMGPGAPNESGSSTEEFRVDDGPWRPLPPRETTDALGPEVSVPEGARRLDVRVRMRAVVLGPGFAVVEALSSGFDAGPAGQLAFAVVAWRKDR